MSPLRLLTPVALFALTAVSQATCKGPGEQNPNATSAPAKSAPPADVEIPGVDTSALTPREKREFAAYVSEIDAPCTDVKTKLAQCAKENGSCKRCLPAAKYLLRQVRDGMTKEQAIDAYKARFDPAKAKNIDVSDTPVKGPADAPVTLVEFADFECPACRAVSPILDGTLGKFPGKVRLFFKHMPLSFHPKAVPAARAAFAAEKQGKFWEMHKTLFEHQPAFDPPDLEKYAKEVGLDLAKFKADASSDGASDRLARDKKHADAAGVDHTPTLYINGREYKGGFQEDLEEWIQGELELAGVAPAKKP